MRFFLLAGGYGRRAVPLSLEKPKPLFPLNGVPLISLMLDQLRKKGCPEGFVNLHHLAGQLRSHLEQEPGVVVFEEAELSGSKVLKRALPHLDDFLLVVNGDVYTEIPLPALKETLLESGAEGVLLVRKAESGYPPLALAGGLFRGVNRGHKNTGSAPMMYTGVALLTPEALGCINDLNFFASFEKHGLRIACLAHRGIWLEIGTPGDYFAAVWKYRRHAGCETGGNALSPGVIIAAEACVRRSIIWENSIIGPGAHLADCILTGNLNLKECRFQRSIITTAGVYPLSV